MTRLEALHHVLNAPYDVGTSTEQGARILFALGFTQADVEAAKMVPLLAYPRAES